MTESATPDELMTIAASRLLEDGKVLFAGIGPPLVAAALAKRRHAPNLTVLLEGGMIGIACRPGELPGLDQRGPRGGRRRDAHRHTTSS